MFKKIRSSVRDISRDFFYLFTKALCRKTTYSHSSRVLVLPGADGWEGGAPFSFGDEMLVVGLLSGLKEKGFKNVDVLSHANVLDRTVDFHGSSVRIVGLKGGWLSLSSYWQLKKMASSYSHCVVIGADVLDGAYSQINSTQRLRFLNVLAKMGLKTRVSGFSFNGTKDVAIRSLFRDIERSGSLIYARERESFIRLRDFLKRPQLSADLAFKVKVSDYPVRDQINDLLSEIELAKQNGVVVVALNICGWHIKNKGEFYLNFVQSLVDKNPFERVAFVLIPHDTRDDVGSDLTALCELRHVLQGKALIIGDPGYIRSGIDAKQVVGVCDVLITGRMHLAIAALHQGVPAVSFSYQGKFEGLYDLFQLPRKLMVSYEDPSAATLVLYEVAKGRDEFVHRIHAALPSVQRLADENFESL